MRLAMALALVLATVSVSACKTQQAERPQVTEAALKKCAPTTFDAAILCLDRYLPNDSKAALKRDGALSAHFGLGLWIRNNWGLWRDGPLGQSMYKMGFRHPDDMSGAILDGFVARLRAEKFDLAEKAVESEAYWKRSADR